MEVVPYYLDARMRPHAITVEQLQTHSAADLDYRLAGGSMAVGSLEVRRCAHAWRFPGSAAGLCCGMLIAHVTCK